MSEIIGVFTFFKCTEIFPALHLPLTNSICVDPGGWQMAYICPQYSTRGMAYCNMPPYFEWVWDNFTMLPHMLILTRISLYTFIKLHQFILGKRKNIQLLRGHISFRHSSICASANIRICVPKIICPR